MTHFAREVLGLDRPTTKIAVRILEATDNAVLYDFYETQREQREKRTTQKKSK